VLWNTRYQDAVLGHLGRDGHDVRDDDHHINLLGRYQFSGIDLADGQFRPLRDPAAPEP